MSEFDVIVLGLGHAGVEACLAAARMGCRVVGVTQALERTGLMSCNPAVGGPGKSQLVAEIDALWGAMALAADESGLQYRVLNRSKGPALRATRVQVDRLAYARAIQRQLSGQPRVTLIQGEGCGLVMRNGSLAGVTLQSGQMLQGRAVVVTAGTFLAGRMHIGSSVEPGGRAGDPPAEGLSGALREVGLKLGRFKTGTPPRLDGRTIDYAKCCEQLSEADAGPLSARTAGAGHPRLAQKATYVTHTTAATHAVVRANLAASPLLTGAITGRGPRYCPSLEHKVSGHPDRERHLVFLEPEGAAGFLVYPAGLSTSLPVEVQEELLRTIPGLEAVVIARPGYAVEYDYVPALQLDGSLEARCCPGLFLAGQINGSSGYEEAAGQGLVAGINAALQVVGKPSWIPLRSESFLGVLCDDLTCRGFDEPYRVLPARADDRLFLREDNASLRLWRAARDLALVPEGRWKSVERLESHAGALESRLGTECLRWFRRPETTLEEAAERIGEGVPPDVLCAVYLRQRYEPYRRQQGVAERRLQEQSAQPIPEGFEFRVVGLSNEAAMALRRARPRTLGEARRVPGMTVSALAVLAAQLQRRAMRAID